MPEPLADETPGQAADAAAALVDEADDLRRAGRLADALAVGRRALDGLRGALGDDHPDVANALLGLGRTHEALDAYEAAEGVYTEAAQVIERWADEPLTAVQRIRVQVRVAVGQVARIRGRLDDAHQTLTGAIALAEARLGPDDLDTGVALNALGITCKYAGRWPEGEAAYRRALAIIEATRGAGSEDAAAVWHNLGGLAFDAGEYEAAEKPARRAVEIRKAALGPDHPVVAADVAALAAIVDALGRTSEAAALYQRALAVLEQAEGVEYDLAVLHHNLGVVAAEHGRTASASGHYRRALAVYERLLGPDHPDVAMTLHNLGVLEGELGRRARAEELLDRALAILRLGLGPSHPRTTACEAALRALGLAVPETTQDSAGPPGGG